MVSVLCSCRGPHSGLNVLLLNCVILCESIIGCQNAQDFEMCVEGCFAIHSVKQRTVSVVFVVDGSHDELCDPGCPIGILLGINLLIFL